MNIRNFWKEFAIPCSLLVVFVIAIFGVFGLVKNFTKPPVITLTSSDNIVTDQSEVPVTGTVKNTGKLTVNGEPIALGQDGGFSTNVAVPVGENKITLEAGNGSTKVTQEIKVTREEVAKAITATNTQTVGGGDLSASGPVESVMGSLGLGAIIVSLLIYRKSKRLNPLQKAISRV